MCSTIPILERSRQQKVLGRFSIVTNKKISVGFDENFERHRGFDIEWNTSPGFGAYILKSQFISCSGSANDFIIVIRCSIPCSVVMRGFLKITITHLGAVACFGT